MESIASTHGTATIALVGAGGKGERMGAARIPKLLRPVYRNVPVLKFNLDMLAREFDEVYVLTGHYEREVVDFVARNYRNGKVRTLYAGTDGILSAYSRVQGTLTGDFVYMDGNMVCRPSAIREVKKNDSSTVRIVASPNNLAPTHLHLRVAERRVVATSLHMQGDRVGWVTSLGLMRVARNIFDLFPGIERYYDIDVVADLILAERTDASISCVVYEDEWYCIHTEDDIALMRTEGRHFFESLQRGGIGNATDAA